MRSFLLVVFTIGTFKFSEGKPCPQASRPHLTRCDMYFRCMMLPSKTHVWVPTHCERGLVYEPNFRLCVLPGDDWECTLGDNSTSEQDDTNRYGINTLVSYPTSETMEQVIQRRHDLVDVKSEVVESNEAKKVSVNKSKNSNETANIEDYFESSGDGAQESASESNLESKISQNEEDLEHLKNSNIDPKLTTQLQRLSQLIEGLRQSYDDDGSSNGDLRPDQLNTFLAHYNIKSKPASSDISYSNKLLIPNDGKIHPAVMNHILDKQKKLAQHANAMKENSTVYVKSKLALQIQTTERPDPAYNSETEFPSNIFVKSNLPYKDYRKPMPDGYTNSQIVVNRPEGSVIFGVPSHHKKPEEYKDVPNISEETLKTILELSKQMLYNQPIRQVFPNNAYVQPLLQPYYYPLAVPNQQENDAYGEGYSTARPDLRKPPTIIKNNVIPITITRPSGQDQEKYDSYGNKLNSDTYPPYPQVYVQPQDTRIPQYSQNSGNDVPNMRPDPVNADRQPYTQGYPSYSYPSSPPRMDTVVEVSKPHHSHHSHANRGNYHSHKKQHYTISNSNQHTMFPDKINLASVKIRPNSYQSGGSSQEDEESYETSQIQQQLQQQSHVNKEIVADLLSSTSDLDQLMTTSGNDNSDPQNNHLVEIGGSFINYNLYKNQLLPALGNTNSLIDKFQVITCTAGIRQPNTTDCTKYYVCNPKNNNVLQYACPPYTAFNSQTHMCDAKTYAFCNPQAIQNRFTVLENKKIQLEALQALQDAKRIRDEAIKEQNLAAMIRLQSQQMFNTSIDNKNQVFQEPSLLANYANPAIQEVPTPIQSDILSPSIASRPASTGSGHKKRIKYRCREGAKVPDKLSNTSYYVCYKDKNGVLKGHKMSCSPGLIFCAKTLLCTLPRRCT